MTIDELIKRLERLKAVYGGDIPICKGIPRGGKLLSVLEYVDDMDVCDAKPFPSTRETTNCLKIKSLADSKKGSPAPVSNGLIRVLYLN